MKQSKADTEGSSCQNSVPSCCASMSMFTNYVVSWQCTAVSVACLATVNAIYWFVMPLTSTITLTAILGSILMLVDLAAYLGKLPYLRKENDTNDTCPCTCVCNVFSKLMSSPTIETYFPSVRSRARFLIGISSACGLFISCVLGISISTIVYIGASLALLSKPLRLSERSEFPMVARLFDSLLALRPDASSIVKSQPGTPTSIMDSVQKSSRHSPALVFEVDPMELDINSPEKPSAEEHSEDELAPYLPSSNAEEELLSNPESTEDISVSLLPSQANAPDSSLILSLRYHPEEGDLNTDDNATADEDEEFELVDSTSGPSDSESASLSNVPTSSSTAAINP